MNPPNTLEKTLSSGLKSLNISLSQQTQTKLIAYLELLNKWNKLHNLTAIRDPNEMVSRHVLDSLSILSYLRGETICDVGTGPGLPGLILALAKPDLKFVLLDSNQKKINFVQQAILSLKLENVITCCVRVENYHPEVLFDSIVSRAFSSLADFVGNTTHLISDRGVWLAMKGKVSAEELADLTSNYTIEHIYPLSLPNILAERNLVVVKKTTSS